MLLTGEEVIACAAAAAAAVIESDSESQDDDAEAPTANLADIADDDDIDENLFDGDDLDIVEQQLDSLEVVDWPQPSVVMTPSSASSQYSDHHCCLFCSCILWFIM